MPSKPKQKDNVSKNMSSRYSTLEPWNLRTKPHTLVIDVKPSKTSPSSSPMECDTAASPSTSISPMSQNVNPQPSTSSSEK